MSSIEVIKDIKGNFHVNRLYPPDIDESVELVEVKLEELSDHLQSLMMEAEITQQAIVKLLLNDNNRNR